MFDKYQLIRVTDDTLYILSKNRSYEDVAGYPEVYSESDCDRMSPDVVYAITDTAMSTIFGR